MYDMTFQLQTGSGKRLYEQIYEHIKKEIKEGKLLAGERLPSTRSLAEYLQVARSTVDTAYEQLASEGYIEPRPQRGYFVCRVEELFQLEREGGSGGSSPYGKSVSIGKGGAAGKVGSIERAGGTGRAGDAGKSGATGQGAGLGRKFLCDFSPNAIDMSAFPFNVWMRITRNVLSGGDGALFSQGEPQGEEELRVTISRYLHSSRGVECRPDQIVVGAGNDYLLLLLEKILGRHVHIAMENPTYKRAYRIFNSFAYPISAVEMDENGMLASELEEKEVSLAYVMPSHQFPTGTVMPIGRRNELLRWADGSEDRYLIEDDYDSEFRYRGKPIPSLQASDRHGKVIYIGTFSKAIAPAIRISYMVLPDRLLERYREECWFYSSTVSRIDQRILNEFIKDGYFERYLNKMRKIYRTKHELMLEGLKPFRKAFRLSGENAGLHLLLTAKGEVSEEELLEKAAAAGVRVYGLSDSYIGRTGEGRDEEKANSAGKKADSAEKRADSAGKKATILLGYGGLESGQIQEGLQILKRTWL